MRRFWGRLATAVLTVAILVAVAPAGALATHVSCGDIITTDTTLDSDLIDCPGNGIMIGADNITLDLNGHTIDGGSSSGDGVANVAHLEATIEGGTIQGFSVGVRLGTCSSGTGCLGDILPSADGNTVRNLTISGNEVAIVLRKTVHNVIRNNELVDNNFGIFVGGDRFVFTGDTLIEKNVIWTTVGAAITTDRTQDEAYVIRNEISVPPGSAGIDAGYGSMHIERNSISGGDWGMHLGRGRGPVIKNHVSNARFDGIYADLWGGGSEFLGNVVTNNGDDGIEIDSGGAISGSSVVLTRNTANDNGDFGIEAFPGVTDGGGNKASGNGNPLQCLNVFCR